MPRATLKIRVIPRASRNQVGERRGEAVTVRLQAPPVEDAANKALVRFLAAELGLRPADVHITAGERSRDKVVEVEGLDLRQVEEALGLRPE